MSFEEELAPIGFNSKEYLRRFDKMPQLYMECLVLYIKSNDIERLNTLFGEGKWQDAYDCAHTLKGSSGNLALMKLWKLYEEIVEILGGSEPKSAAHLIKKASALEAQLREIAKTMKKGKRSSAWYNEL